MKKQPLLTFLAGGLTVLALGAAFPRQADPVVGGDVLRFQIRDSQDIVVIDTHTGEVWRHLQSWNSLGKPGQ